MRCTPNPGHRRRGIFVSKFTLEFKLECIEKFKNHEKIEIPKDYTSLPDTFYHNVRDWYNAFRNNGVKALSTNGQNLLTYEQKLALVRLVITGKTVRNVAAEHCIGHGNLSQWVKKYKLYGEDGLKCFIRGKKTRNLFMKSRTKKSRISPSVKEELELLRKRNEYLEAEVEYLKKLDALETTKEAKHPKAKKQK